MIIKANDFKTRQDLEEFIKAEIGVNIPDNKESDHTIQGKRKDLKRLFLSDTSSVFGIKCVITDTPTKNLVKIKKIK